LVILVEAKSCQKVQFIYSTAKLQTLVAEQAKETTLHVCVFHGSPTSQLGLRQQEDKQFFS